MREIKFRVWDGKEMYSPRDAMNNGFSLEPNGDVYQWDAGKWGDDDVPMFFTGLTDKNGTEIYEGDVVEMGQGIDHKREVVQWSDDLCGFHPFAKPNSAGYYNWRDYDTLEPLGIVCGNIYEDPELIE